VKFSEGRGETAGPVCPRNSISRDWIPAAAANVGAAPPFRALDLLPSEFGSILARGRDAKFLAERFTRNPRELPHRRGAFAATRIAARLNGASTD
jgi:hypothetical protein